MEVYKRKGSKYWLVDFVVDAERQRRSTRATTKTRAMEVAAGIIKQAQEQGGRPVRKGPAPILANFADEKFLPYVDGSQLDLDTKLYYRNGWRMVRGTAIAGWRMDRITTPDAETLQFPGSGSNANCALRTLRRMLSLAKDWGMIQSAPRIKLRKERERSLIFTPDNERALLDVAPQPLRDVFVIEQDSGLRPDETVRLRWDNILWDKNLIFNPDGKTEKSRRYVPLSDRARTLLRARAQGATSEWVFPSPRRKGAHITYSVILKQFTKARKDAGLPDELVLYSARHTFATDMLDRTGNLILVKQLLGHESVKTTEKYLHPAMKGIADVVNERNAERHTLRHSQDGAQS